MASCVFCGDVPVQAGGLACMACDVFIRHCSGHVSDREAFKIGALLAARVVGFVGEDVRMVGEQAAELRRELRLIDSALWW